MEELNRQKLAGEKLRLLIKQKYNSQEEFAYDFGAEPRTVSRYINNGINKISIIQELADYFQVDFIFFFTE